MSFFWQRALSPFILATFASLLAFGGSAPRVQLIVDVDAGLTYVADPLYAVNSGFSREVLIPKTDALELVQAMNDGRLENFGYRDWRLSTPDELRRLVRREEMIGDLTGLKRFLASDGGSSGISPRAGKTPGDVMYPWPVRGIVAPDGFDQIAIFATNSAFIKNERDVTGNVVVNAASTADTIDPNTDVELRLGRNATVNGDVTAVDIQLDRGSDVTGTTACTTIDDADDPSAVCAAASFPVYPDPPAFQPHQPRAGAADLFVDDGEVVVVPLPPAPGETEGVRDFANITIAQNGTLVFEGGGVFNIGSISEVSTVGGQCPYPCRRVLFSEFADIRVEGRWDTGKDSCVGATSGPDYVANADCPADDVPDSGTAAVIYVGGPNSGDGSATALPASFMTGRDSTLGANVYANAGSVVLDRGTRAKGALLGRDVLLDKDARLVLDSAFANEPPTAEDVVVFTNGMVDLVIPLVGEDPEGGDLMYAIVAPGLSDPAAGSLGPITENFENVSGDPPGCTPGVDCVREPGTVLVSVTVTYSPATDQNEFNSFQYKVTDDRGEMATATVTINPGEDPNDPPENPDPVDTVLAFDAMAETVEDTTATIEIKGEAPCDMLDPDGECASGVALSFAVEGGCSGTACGSPSFGTLSNLTQGGGAVQRTATVDYTPDPGHIGSDSFEFEACGTIGAMVVCDRATVSVETAPAPDPVEDREFTAEAQAPITFSLGLNPDFTGGGSSSSSALSPRRNIRIKAAFIQQADASGVTADTDSNGSGDEAAVWDFVSAADSFGGSGTFSDEENFLAELPNATRFDFEGGSGAVGTIDGIAFDAQYFDSSQATSGDTTMTGAGGTFTVATVDFSGLGSKPNAFGFVALDLTTIGPEVIRVTVDYTTLPDQVIDVQLGPNDPTGTPIYFGLIEPSDTIESLSFVGTEVGSSCPGGTCRAWLIDDLSVGRVYAGEARFQIEFDLGPSFSLDNLESANVSIPAHANALGLADTQLYFGTASQDGNVTAADFEAPGQILPGGVLSPTGMAVGDVQTFGFDVLDVLTAGLQDGGQVFTLQGRVGTAGAQGLQVFGTTTKNVTDFLAPTLSITTPGVIAPDVVTILTLPQFGTLFDSTGTAITTTGTITDGNLTYIADPLADPNITLQDSFTYEVNGLDTGTVFIFIQDNCAKVGRPPGCSPDDL
ncbi:MAG TPA: hypothetical protein VLV83_23965 [Acidobacteriota bacterium]|nr:hypothetical protein [Acidobacteriota bacterium]